MEQSISHLSTGSAASILAFFLVMGAFALYRRWIVLGWTYQEVKDERDELKTVIKEDNSTKLEMANALNNLTQSIGRLFEQEREHERRRGS